MITILISSISLVITIFLFMNLCKGAGESVNYYLKNFVKDFLNNNFMFLKEHHVLLCKTVNVFYLKKYFLKVHQSE
jgi:hypothetical protein